MTINQNSGTVEDEITTYFTDNPLSKPLWYFKDDENTAWIMSYKKGSLKQDTSDKKNLTVDINLKNSINNNDKKFITIHLDSHKIGDDTKNLIWKQITSEINKAGYENKNNSLSIKNVENFINVWILYDKTTWYETTNNHIIKFTASDVKINSDGVFTTTLKPSTTTDGNKDVSLALKWWTNADKKPDDLISAIQKTGYWNAPVFISSMVKSAVNAYLDADEWAKKGSGEIRYKFIATKVVGTFSTKWTVTIDQKKSLKTRNLDFKPFDITLDWKDQKDATDKISEINTQIKDGPHYIKLLNANGVRTIFNNFLISGRWDFIPNIYKAINRQVYPKIDLSVYNKGVYPSAKADNTWTIAITFVYTKKYVDDPTKYITYKNIIGLNWQFAAPDFTRIATNVTIQLNTHPNNYRFKFTPFNK